MPISIAVPPWTKLGKNLESLCRKALYDFSMIDPSSPLTIGVSGGKDSLSLLFLLHAISGRGFCHFHMHAIHVEEHFSSASFQTKKIIEEICDQLNIPLIVKPFPSFEGKLDCYVCSRIRRRLLFEAAREIGSSTVALGHHRDDHVQTLLMNLLQKAEFCSMLPKIKMIQYGVSIIRPLIYIAEEEIIRFAKLHGFYIHSCSCPYGKNTKRKAAERVIQQLEKEFPMARKNLFRSALLYGSKKALKQ